jgi:membrane-bound lytic murein transglycosylase F
MVLVLLFAPHKEYAKPSSQQEIVHSDTIQVLLYYHASDYIMYKGDFIGFQYDLFKYMEKALNKVVNVKIEYDQGDCFRQFFTGKYDIVAMDYDPKDVAMRFLTLSVPHSQTFPVLISATSVSDIIDSNNIYITSPYPPSINADSLAFLPNNKLVFQAEKSSEMLFDDLENQRISYIIADNNDALLLLPFYSNIQIIKQVGYSYDRRWGLNPCNKMLNDTINQWLSEFTSTKIYANLCKKYLSGNSAKLINAGNGKGKYKISPYDKIIEKHSKKYQIDWRLVAAIMYQESKFMNGLTGIGGSFGLMQMMPSTGARYGINENSSAEEQILAGIKHLVSLRNKYKMYEEEELWCMVVAAYNAGGGHIQDAQLLCQKYQEDDTRWQNVSKYLQRLSQYEYARDTIVHCGFFPGNHTVKYVKEVMDRYHNYKNIK